MNIQIYIDKIWEKTLNIVNVEIIKVINLYISSRREEQARARAREPVSGGAASPVDFIS